MALAQGSEAQKQMLQDAINRFASLNDVAGQTMITRQTAPEVSPGKSNVSPTTNSASVSVDNTIPQVEMLGMTVPDPDLHFDTESGHYRFGEIDWQEFNEVINGRGICNQERLDAKRKAQRYLGTGSSAGPCTKTTCP
ncbi:hypothetical protein ACLB1S_14260 [Escherichia coli]